MDTVKPLAAIAFAMLSGLAQAELPLDSVAAAERLVRAVAAENRAPERVRVRAPTEDEHDFGVAMRVENDGSCTLVLGGLLDGFIPESRRVDPLVQEFVVLHELAHCHQAQLRQTFGASQLAPDQNAAIHDLVVIGTHLEAVQLYVEIYADVRAALAVSARHSFDDDARRLVADIAHWRAAADMRLGDDGVHATAGALEGLLAEFDSLSNGTAEAREAAALRIASDAMIDAARGEPRLALQLWLNKRTIPSARYAIWLWSAACTAHPERSLEFYRREATRLSHPVGDLLDKFVAECSAPDGATSGRVRTAFDRAETALAARLAGR
jgi:hypothetical protein